jgi:hypothetical protein
MGFKDARLQLGTSGSRDGSDSINRMETAMRNTRNVLIGILAAAGLAAASAGVYADPPGGFGPGAGGCAFGAGMAGGGYGPGMTGGGPRGGFGPGAAAGAGPVERADARLAYLKNELKITAEQESAWDAYATQVKAQAATMAAFHAQGPSTAQSAAERIEQHAARMKLRAEQAQKLSAAVKDLYAVLTPEQQTIANQHFGGPRFGQAGGRGHGGRRWN